MFFPKKMLPVGNGMFKEIISHWSWQEDEFSLIFQSLNVKSDLMVASVRVNEWWNGIDFV